MKTFIAMLTMSVGFMLFSQTMTTESVMKDYKIQHDKIVSEFVLKMRTLNNVTIKKLEPIKIESSKSKIEELSNWSIDDETMQISDMKDPSTVAAVDRKPVPKDAVEFKGHHYLLINLEQNGYSGAEEYCKSLGGDLMHPDNKSEVSFIVKYLNNNASKKNIYRIKALDIDKDSTIIKLLNIKNSSYKTNLNNICWSYNVGFEFNNHDEKYFLICEWDY